MQLDDHVCLRGCLPSDLMIELGGRPGPGKPLAESDPARVALAKLEAGAPAQPRHPAPPQVRPTVSHLDDAAGVLVVDTVA